MGRKGGRRGGSQTRRRIQVPELASDVLRGQLEAARAHVQGAIAGTDPEDLHDLRVAVRRIRAALRLFERALPAADAALDPARAGLKATGAVLGRARDLDVQIARLELWLREGGRLQDSAALRALKLLERDRSVARLALRSHLRGRVFEQRLEAVARAAEAAGAVPARRSAPRLLRRPSKQVLIALARAGAAPHEPAAFHALRIDIKRLRYTLEILSPALPFAADGTLRSLRSAQETLGALQDAAVEQALAERLIERARGDEPVRELLVLYRDSQLQAQVRQLRDCESLLDALDREVRALRSRL